MRIYGKYKSGFTLIELLVVISIIALLLSILMPALSKVKAQATKVVCLTRHKDIAMVLNLYANDNDQKLPHAYYKEGDAAYTRLPYKLKGYYDLKGEGSSELWDFEMFRCPTQNKFKNDDGSYTAMGTYGYNTYFFQGKRGGSYPKERSILSIRRTAELPLMGCLSAENYEGYGGGAGQEMKVKGPHPKALKYGYIDGEASVVNINGYCDWFGPAPNHGKDANFSFADGHVESRNVCVDESWPWIDHIGTAFHPKGVPSYIK